MIRFILQRNKKLSAETADRIVMVVLEQSGRFQVEPRLLLALMAQGSNFNPKFRSMYGEMGLGGLLPNQVQLLKIKDPYSIEENIRGMALILRQLEQMWPDHPYKTEFVLIAYKRGVHFVQAYLQQGEPFPDPLLYYVEEVKQFYYGL